MTIVISGATGFIAKNLRYFLQQNNTKFIGLGRKNFKNYKLEKKLVSDYSEKSLQRAIRGCDTFIHLIGVGKQSVNSSYTDVNLNLTKHIIKVCKKAKIRKIIFNSGLGVSRESTSNYFISKYRAEQEIINSRLDYTIFRPSYVIGKDDYLTKNLKNQAKNGIIKIPGSGKYQIQPIFVNDVTKIIIQAIYSKKFSNKILDLVGPEKVSFETFVKHFAIIHKVKTKKIDLEKMYYDALHNADSDYGIDDLNILIGNFTGNHKKIKELSKFEFTLFKKVLQTSSLS